MSSFPPNSAADDLSLFMFVYVPALLCLEHYSPPAGLVLHFTDVQMTSVRCDWRVARQTGCRQSLVYTLPYITDKVTQVKLALHQRMRLEIAHTLVSGMFVGVLLAGLHAMGGFSVFVYFFHSLTFVGYIFFKFNFKPAIAISK